MPDRKTVPDITICHNPGCGTSRNVLGLIRNSGIEPEVIEYLKTPPSRDELSILIGRMGISARDLLLDAMMAHPILINRPVVVSPMGVKLCRPSEAVLDLLPAAQLAAFSKEDSRAVVDASGQRIV